MTSASLAIPSYQDSFSGNSAPELTPGILIVDDQPVNRDLVARILSAEGFRTSSAGNGDEALTILRSTSIDLILLDVCMPGQSGLDLCQLLQRDRSLRRIPVIFLSAKDEPGDRLRGLAAGGVDYIVKPFYAEEVLARVRVHLRLEHAFRCLARQQERQMAELRDAQRSILVTPGDLPEASFAICYRPLGEVGGDFYDVLQLGPGTFGYLVSDISGHGVGASFLTSSVKVLLRQYSGPLFSPEETMRSMNRVIKTMVREGQYLTAAYVRYSGADSLVSVVSAAHPAPIHVRTRAKPVTFPAQSEALGAFDTVALTRRDMLVHPGDRFYLYTDGLIEDPALPGGGRNRGVEKLCEACEKWQGAGLERAVQAIADELRPANREAMDDMLLLGMEVPD